MKIVFCKSIEAENKAEIEKYLNPFLWLVPKWVQKVSVNLYASNGGDAAIATLVDYEYRKITVDFYTCWLNESPETKQENVIHECVHFFVNNLYHEARGVVNATCDDNKQLKEYAFEQLRVAVEGVTQDLAFAIYEKFNGK